MYARGQVFQYMVISEAPTQDWEHVKYMVKVIIPWDNTLNWHHMKARQKRRRSRREFVIFDIKEIVLSQLEFRHMFGNKA
jgi:hypothetical protein